MRAVTVLFTVSLLLGCNADKSAESQAPPASTAAADGSAATDKPSCELLTDAEVGEATGGTVSGHEETGLSGCRWRIQGGTTLMLDVYSGSMLAPATCGAQKVLGTGREEEVSGLGESAQWKTSGSLVVCTERAVLRFNLDDSPRTVPENREGLVSLARRVLGRLDK